MCACAECRDRACSSFGCSFYTDRAHLSPATGVSPAEVCSLCLLGAALRSECVCVVAVVFASPRRGWCWTLPISLSLAPRPPSLFPDPARRCPLPKTWRKLESASRGLPPFSPCTLLAVAHVLCCCLVQVMSKSLKKLVEESREKNQPEVDMSDRGISNMLDVNGLCKFSGGPSSQRGWTGLSVNSCWWRCETF